MNTIELVPKLLVLRIELCGIEPLIYREVLVRNTVKFDKLHKILQIAMGWEEMHMFEFIKGKSRIVMKVNEENPSPGEKTYSISATPVNLFLLKARSWVDYWYDFGDDWFHRVTVIQVLPDDPNVTHPQCLKALRACPPEDCGGIPGYLDMLYLLESKKPKSEYNELIEWLGDDFKPGFVDIAKINAGLKR